jgi:hypothetical protein
MPSGSQIVTLKAYYGGEGAGLVGQGASRAWGYCGERLSAMGDIMIGQLHKDCHSCTWA